MHLSLGNGETIHGEGIPAATKALRQSGVGYAGYYQGAPVSHLIDALGDAEALLHELASISKTTLAKRAAPPSIILCTPSLGPRR
jgi:indolepyruvate ferredoxin oxidoreductase alpha subunit